MEEASQIFLFFSGIVLDKYMSNDAPYDHNDPLKIVVKLYQNYTHLQVEKNLDGGVKDLTENV